MFWAKREFQAADYAVCQDRLAKLMMADAGRYREYIMVSVKGKSVIDSIVYVGVPDQRLLAVFDGFDHVAEADLPKEIDTLLVAEGSSKEFTNRFKFKHL